MSEEIVIPAPAPEDVEAQRIAELDAVSKQRIAAESEAAAKQSELEQLETEKASLEFTKAVGAARLTTGLKFHLSTKDLIRLLADEPDVSIDPRSGEVFADGKRISLEDALHGFARRHPWSTERSPVEAQRNKKYDGIEAKDQLIGTSQRVAFVRKFGQAAFEELPLRAVPRGDLTALPPSELRKLPTAEKTKIIRRVGEAGWASLLDPAREPRKDNSWTQLSKAIRGQER